MVVISSWGDEGGFVNWAAYDAIHQDRVIQKEEAWKVKMLSPIGAGELGTWLISGACETSK